MSKSSEERSVEYFGEMLKELLGTPEVPVRKRNQANRSYANAKRGNFQGGQQAKARKNLQELARIVKDD